MLDWRELLQRIPEAPVRHRAERMGVAYLPVWKLRIDDWRPDARLSINGRRRSSHWTVRKLQAEAKQRVGWALREADGGNGLPHFDELVEVEIVFCYPSRRRRDGDGLAGMAKPILDAMVDEGIFVDDDTEHVQLIVTARAPSKAGTEIRVLGRGR